MNRCSFCEWIPILPLPVWPLAGQFLLGQNVVVGSMTLLLAVRGTIATRSMSGPPFALQLHRTTVWCGATTGREADHLLAISEPIACKDPNPSRPSRARSYHFRPSTNCYKLSVNG